MKKGDIYYADLSSGCIGSEQRGFRPVLIVQNNTGNKYSNTVIIAPISTFRNREKKKLPVHVSIQHIKLNKNSTVQLDHIRAVDKKRLWRFVGKANIDTMEKVDRALKISLGIRENKNIVDKQKRGKRV